MLGVVMIRRRLFPRQRRPVTVVTPSAFHSCAMLSADAPDSMIRRAALRSSVASASSISSTCPELDAFESPGQNTTEEPTA